MVILERKYAINVFDTDHTGRLGLVSLFNFFQDLAGRHASLLGFGREHLMTNGFFWVLSRISVEIDKMPSQWEEVTIRTWPRGTESIFALRDFDVYNTSGQKIAAASSSWVVVDHQTRKLQRPDRALSHLNSSFPEMRALNTNAAKVPPVPQETRSVREIIASTTDIDVNMHVNNANYIQWICNSYDPEYITNHVAQSVEVNYLSEGRHGDVAGIISASEDHNRESMIHSIVRKSDNTELCRMRVRWREEKVQNVY